MGSHSNNRTTAAAFVALALTVASAACGNPVAAADTGLEPSVSLPSTGAPALGPPGQLLPLEPNDQGSSSDGARPAAAAAASPAATSSACAEPKFESTPLAGGRAQISIDAPCHGNELVALGYGSFVFLEQLNSDGKALILFDFFQGNDEILSVMLQNGRGRVLPPTTEDLSHVSKIAVIWSEPVRLDLHAFEFAAAPGQAGHVWKEAPSTQADAFARAAAGGRGGGFLSLASTESLHGPRVEVYTFIHASDTVTGTVAFALDYQTRGSVPEGESCGRGRYATIPVETVVFERGHTIARESVLLAAAKCGERLAPEARYQRGVVDNLKAGR